MDSGQEQRYSLRHGSGVHAVREVESVSGARQFDVADVTARGRSEALDEGTGLRNRDDAVTRAVHHEERWRVGRHPFDRRGVAEHLGMKM